MSIYSDFKKAISVTVDVIVDKTTTQAQKSRLVTVMKNEEKIANQAYIELGKYLYRNMSKDMPPEVRELCKKIDESKERMSRAQQIYREVIQQELVNREINKSEAKESFQKIKEPIVSKAKDTASKVKETVRDTAKDTAAKVGELKDAAAEKAEEIKNKSHKSEEDENSSNRALTDEEIKAILTPFDNMENSEKVIVPIEHETDAGEEVESILTVGQGLNNEVEVINGDVLPEPIEENTEVISAESEITQADEAEFAPTETEAEAEAEELGESFVPSGDVIDQEFQRNVPVDIITENDFEEDELEVKPTAKKVSFKATKLRDILKNPKKNEDE